MGKRKGGCVVLTGVLSENTEVKGHENKMHRQSGQKTAICLISPKYVQLTLPINERKYDTIMIGW